jgi:peptidoglycan hydrolase CwlO-like protein
MKFLEVKLIISIIVVASLVQVVLTNNLVSAGTQVAKLEKEKSVLETDIESLNNQISAETSLENVASRASRLGLVSSSSSFDFLSPSLVAARADVTP